LRHPTLNKRWGRLSRQRVLRPAGYIGPSIYIVRIKECAICTCFRRVH
jgi:hypothetical protein